MLSFHHLPLSPEYCASILGGAARRVAAELARALSGRVAARVVARLGHRTGEPHELELGRLRLGRTRRRGGHAVAAVFALAGEPDRRFDPPVHARLPASK